MPYFWVNNRRGKMVKWLGNIPLKNQFLISTTAVAVVASSCFVFYDAIGYRVVALLLLLTLSLLALFVDILPLVVTAILSAAVWDFFFIPPRFKFSVGTSEDRTMFLMYLIVVLIHSVLTSKIRQMKGEIQKREERARDLKFYNTLFNSLSHELKTPITTILAATDSLLLEPNRLTGEDRYALLLEINSASLRLNRQLENLLGMSRLESGAIKIKKDWVDIKELVYQVLSQLESLLQNKRVNVTIQDSLPLIKLDYALMEQVVYNLVSNAALYTPEGTVIQIDADCVEHDFLFTVSDTGKGFPEKEITRVFEKFYRVRGSQSGGTGLGLSIVKGFVEAQGGAISLRNLALSGAEFSIKIPTEFSFVNRLKND